MNEDDSENQGKQNKADEPAQEQSTRDTRCDCERDLETIVKEAVCEGINAAMEPEPGHQHPQQPQATYDKCFQECTYCGGWWDVENGPYIRDKNVSFIVSNPQRGVRKVCSKCLIGLFDHIIPRRTGIPGGSLNNENGSYR